MPMLRKRSNGYSRVVDLYMGIVLVFIWIAPFGFPG